MNASMPWVDVEDLQERCQRVVKRFASSFEFLAGVFIYIVEVVLLTLIVHLAFYWVTSIEGAKESEASKSIFSFFTWAGSFLVCVMANMKHLDEISKGKLGTLWRWIVSKVWKKPK